MTIDDFFQALWQSYVDITPQAARIQDLFKSKDETVVNDHIAFRTFAHSPISLQQLEPILIQLGYSAYGEFRFEDKHLRARCYRHSDPEQPKIFLSELLHEELSEPAQKIIQKLIDQIPEDAVQSPAIFWQGRLWSVPTLTEYKQLAQESEYAAWVATIGVMVNHFTVSINHLHRFNTIQSVNQLLLDNGYRLNEVGGTIKGSPDVYLEQSSTMADQIEFTFSDVKKSM
ncbi:MAG: DUF1338 domain-containing protein [Gammaproteobacteria bacterium]